MFKPSKTAKYGIKIFALVNSKMFYSCNLKLHAGKQPEAQFADSNKCINLVNRIEEQIHIPGKT